MKEYIAKVAEGENLTEEEAKGAMDIMLSGDATQAQIAAFLALERVKGETLDVEDVTGMKKKGWHLFCVDGYPLGWGKLASGTLKNKYLPGWRWQS